MAYLDHAASTRLRPAAREAWLSAADLTGNASSPHAAGRAARRVVEEARERLAGALGVEPAAVIFTSGGTESDNLAVLGIARARRAEDARREVVVISAVEHKAVSEPAAALSHEGFRTVVVGVDRAGVVDPVEVQEVLAEHRDAVALVTVMWVNNEVGSVQPITELARICARSGVPLHSDAVQAVGAVPLVADADGLTTIAISGHKVGGPHGIGALLVRTPAAVRPVVLGGGQESGLRGGTLDPAGIAGMAAAVAAATVEQPRHAARVEALTAELWAGIRAVDPSAVRNSCAAGHPGIENVTFPGCEGDALMLLLDAAGICVSTGSACTAGIPRPSAVLRAMGRNEAEASSALRFSLGWDSTGADIADCLAALPEAVARARRASAVAPLAAAGGRGGAGR